MNPHRSLVRLSFVAFAAVASAAATAEADISKMACVEANTKGQDLRREGMLSAAREQLRTCADPSCPRLVRNDCTKRLDQLDQVQPTVVLAVKDGTGRDLRNVKVSIDGKPLAERLTGVALPVDPGAHSFTFEVQGLAPVTRELVLREGEKGRTEVVVFGGANGAGEQAPTPPAPPPEAVSPASSTPASGGNAGGAGEVHGGGTQRTLGFVVGGVGAALLAAGAVFGGLTILAHSDYEKNCGSNIGAPEGQCNPQGVSGQSDAAMKGTLSTAFFAAGGAAVVVGAVLFLTAPTTSASVKVGVGPSGLLVRGAW
jgi:hypothetical protein